MKPFAYRSTTAPLEFENLRILGIDLHEQMPSGLVHRQQGLDSYLLAMFHSEVIVRLPDATYHSPPQSLFIWEPDVCQHYGAASAPWEYSWMTCDGLFLQTTLDTLAIPCNQRICLPDPSCIDVFIQSVYREFSRYYQPDQTIVHHLLHNFLVEVQRQLATPDSARQLPNWANEIKQYLDLHFSESLTVDDLAEYVHCSRVHFYRKFKQLFCMSPMDYLTQVRMHRAKELLLDSNLSITDIAVRAGYANYNYFSTAFRHYYDVSPREMRKGLCGEAGRQQRVEERRNRELMRGLREGWQVVVDADFTHTTQIVPQLHGFWMQDVNETSGTALHIMGIEHGLLRLYPNLSWTGIAWDGELAEELKVDVVIVNNSPEGVNLAIAISGDLRHGYRLRLYRYEYIALETVLNGAWEILHRCPVVLNQLAPEYHVTFWRSDNVFYAEVDGRRILEYHEPFAPQGPLHRGFALARFHEGGSADLRALRVSRRIAPRYVDILEPGRILLWEGHRQSAAAWFRRVHDEHDETALQQEAAYLMVLAVPDNEREAKERAFCQATDDQTSPFHARLLRQWAFTRLEWGDIAGAVDMALVCAQQDTEDDIPQVIAEKILIRVPRMSPTACEQALESLARLPLTRLRLHGLTPVSLHPLRGMALRELFCGETCIADLTPLRGMPLEHLSIQRSMISDLTPLADIPLISLECNNSQLQTLAPLHGLSLRSFNCTANEIADLSPLTGQPLTLLDCTSNRIVDLSPLHRMPLDFLHCADNAIQNLSPLHGIALRDFDCCKNRISDLTPLTGMSLQRLACADNQIIDLSPLRAMPLTVLECHRNAIADLSPLAGLPLRRLTCGNNPLISLQALHGMSIEDLAIEGIPLSEENMQILQELPLRHLTCDLTDPALTLLRTHPTLQGMNHYTAEFLRDISVPLRQAVAAWQQPKTPGNQRLDLRQYARVCGAVRYLALPIRLSRSAAESFCQFYAGTLACPATAEQFLALHTYFASITCHGTVSLYNSLATSYHLGLVRDPEGGAFRWLSGEPYRWQQWHTPDDACAGTAGIPYVFMQQAAESSHSRWDPNPETHYYVILQWPTS